MKPWLIAVCLVASFFLAAVTFLATLWVAFGKQLGQELLFAFAAHLIYALPAGVLGVLLSVAALKLYPKRGIFLVFAASLAGGALTVPLMLMYETARQEQENRRFYAEVSRQGDKNWTRLQTLGFPKLTKAEYKGEMFPPQGLSVVLSSDLAVEDAVADARATLATWDEIRIGSRHYFGRLAPTGELDRVAVYDSPGGTHILIQRISADHALYQTIEPFAECIQLKRWDKAADFVTHEYLRQIGGAEGLARMIESRLPPMKSKNVIPIGSNGPLDQWASFVVPSHLEGKEFLFVALEKKSGLWRVFKLAPTDWEGAYKLNGSLGSEPTD
jgi:hypothetical protein